MTYGSRIRRWKWIVFVTIIFVCINLTQHYVFSADKELFPVPENLKTNIQFWKKVFTLYNNDQVIIHDANNLEVIYEICNLTEIFGIEEVSEKEKWQEVEIVKEKYKNILHKLATLKNIIPDSLETHERYVYNLFKNDPSPKTFRKASHNIRGQKGLKDRFREGMIRSGQYLPQIENIFKKHNVPQELKALPHVESSFDFRAYSKYGAAGMWQFTRRTGRRFLKINYTLDERFDPIKSTEAAAKLLKDNYEKLGSWPLAITAYNHGVHGMLRAVSKVKTSDLGEIVKKYKSRSFKFASRNFYAEFLAAKEVEENFIKYFGELQIDRPEKYLTFTVPNYIKISTLAKRLDIPIIKIAELNPSLRKSVLTSRRRIPKGFELKIPYRKNFDPVAVYAQIPDNEKFHNQLVSDCYRVKRGDNLNGIARRFRTTVSDLLLLNEIDNPNHIFIGQVLKIKSEKATSSNQEVSPFFAQNNKKSENRKNEISFESGEHFSGPHVPDKIREVEKKVNLTEKKALFVSEQNEKTNGDNLTKIFKKTDNKITVQPGETLGHFADWLKIPTQELRNLNDLGYGEDIHVAQNVKITFRNVTAKQFNQSRMEFHRLIEENFFTMFKINDVKIHKIKKGDNIWHLCNEVYEIPYWLILKYNPEKNLRKLRAGDMLLVPIIELLSNDNAG